jgi:hypothetical protein
VREVKKERRVLSVKKIEERERERERELRQKFFCQKKEWSPWDNFN